MHMAKDESILQKKALRHIPWMLRWMYSAEVVPHELEAAEEMNRIQMDAYEDAVVYVPSKEDEVVN